MSWDGDAFARIVEILDSEPSQQCVIRQEFFDELGLDPEAIGNAAKREVERTFEIREIPTTNMAVREFVFVYAPKRES